MSSINSSHRERHARPRHVLLAVTVGNMLEWYDFAVYGFLTPVIAKVIFPAADPAASLLLSVGAFGVGFLTRPVGALVFGVLADRKGRKLALLLTFGLMGIATFAIGLIPPFASIGVAAPLLVVFARLLQGLATGGAVGGAIAMLTEHAPPGRSGFFASWQAASQAGALLLGALATATISAIVSPEQLNAWGWRVPFFASAVIVPLGLYIRRRVDDPETFVRQTPASSPLKLLLRTHSAAVARGFGITIIWTVSTYFFFVYVPLYAHTVLNLSMSTTLFTNSLALALMLGVSPLAGHLSDRFGRYRLMIAAAVAIVLLIRPGFGFLLNHPHAAALATFQAVSAVLAALFIGPAPAAIAELFPSGVRSSGVGIAYNFSVTLFGGFAPLIATGLIARTGNPLSPTWYVMFSCGLSLLALLLTLRTNSRGPY
ncbi:MAG TPA: MFS transporter [Steroidobacteraceae bacterium]|nr:MFS transporter [Steroidobacteraceae bacterium]